MISLALSYFFFFCGVGLFVPYQSSVFIALGFSRAEAGLLQSVATAFLLILPAWVGRLSDRFFSADKVLRVCTLIALISAVWFWQQTKLQVLWFCVAYFLLAAARSPIISLQDTLALQVAKGEPYAYARLRVMGSLGFVTAATCAGLIFKDHLLERFFPALVIVMFLLTCASFGLPKEKKDRVENSEEKGFWQSLSKHWWYWLFAVTLHWFSFGPYHFGLTLFLRDLHFSESTIGIIWSLGVFSEILTFLASRYLLQYINHAQALMIALSMTWLRWFLLGLFPSQTMVWCTQLLHGPGFALFYAASLHSIDAYSGGRFRASYQGLFATSVSGFGAALGIALGGFLYQYISFPAILLSMLIPQTCALYLAFKYPLKSPLAV